jgi:hypothetical protein
MKNSQHLKNILLTGLVFLYFSLGQGNLLARADGSDWWSEPVLYKSVGKAEFLPGDQVYRYAVEGLTYDAQAFALSFFGEDNLAHMAERTEEDNGAFSMRSSEDFGAMYYTYGSTGGWCVVIKPGNIPLSYKGEFSDDSPLPSAEEGLRTAEEADAYVRAWFAEQFGLDTSLLTCRVMDQEDPNKAKSKMYNLYYDYILDERHLSGAIGIDGFGGSGINVCVTDEGVVFVVGTLWRVTDKKSIDPSSILTPEAIHQLHQIDEEILLQELCYALFPVGEYKLEARPVWYIITPGDYVYYDALTGKAHRMN